MYLELLKYLDILYSLFIFTFRYHCTAFIIHRLNGIYIYIYILINNTQIIKKN